MLLKRQIGKPFGKGDRWCVIRQAPDYGDNQCCIDLVSPLLKGELKLNSKLKAFIVVLFVLSGCATTGTNGVVKIGPDLYMLGGLGNFTDFSSSGVKARFFQEGSAFCEKQGRVMQPVNSTGQDSGFGTYASAEVQFRCLAKDDLRVAK